MSDHNSNNDNRGNGGGSGDNKNGNKKYTRYTGFVNDEQRKFHLIGKAFKIGNIIATIVAIFFIGKYFLGWGG
jgi:hypothetical protein